MMSNILDDTLDDDSWKDLDDDQIEDFIYDNLLGGDEGFDDIIKEKLKPDDLKQINETLDDLDKLDDDYMPKPIKRGIKRALKGILEKHDKKYNNKNDAYDRAMTIL